MKLAKRNYNGLGTFIRLVDYMVVETQVKINQESADLILAEMAKDSKKYGIQTTVSFAQEDMSFEPAKTEFITQFEKILQDMQSVTEEVSRVISHQDFHQFIHGLISDSGPRFRAIVEDSEAYSTSKTTIQRRIALDFEELQQIVKKFEACRVVDDFDRDFVFEEWKKDHSDHEAIRAKLSDLAKWEAAVGRIAGQDAKGLVLVQGRKLAARLSQRVKEEQGRMKEYLLELAELKAKEIQTGLQEIKQTLKAAPGSLTSYVEYVSKVQMCKVRKDALAEEKKRKLEEMKGVLSKYRGKDEPYPNVP